MATITLQGDRHSGHSYKVRLFLKQTDTPTVTRPSTRCILAGYLYWLSNSGLEIGDWPDMEAWLRRLSELEHWQHPDELMA